MDFSARPAFTVEGQAAGGRRRGTLSARGWRLTTPAVVPVGPLATGGSLTAGDLSRCGVRALGVDWLRLCLRPGVGAIAALGGLRRFVGWSGPLVAGPADWVFEGASATRVRADVASVVSPVDGSTRRLTPGEVVEAQIALEIDFAATLDWPDVAARGSGERGLDRLRLDWAERSLVAANGRIALLAEVPVTSTTDVIRALGRLPFDGFVLKGIGEAVGAAALGRLLAQLPSTAIRVVDWRGGPSGVADAVSAGVDLIRLPGDAWRARVGTVFADEGEVAATSAAWLDDSRPIEPGCRCPACDRFSRAYIRHLYDAGELLGTRLIEAHNLATLTDSARKVSS